MNETSNLTTANLELTNPDLVINVQKAHDMALASNELRSQAAVEKAIGTVLVEAVKNDTDLKTLKPAQPTGLGNLSRIINEKRYDEALAENAVYTAHKRALPKSLNEAPDYRVDTVRAAQETIQNKDKLSVQATEAEQVAADKYYDEKLQDSSVLGTTEGREAVAQELLQKLQ